MLDFSRFEFLTFDCYGTLIDWESGILSAFHRILDAHGKKMDDAALLSSYGDFEQRAEQSTFQPYREVLAAVVGQFGAALGFTPSSEEQYSLSGALRSWKPWPDTVAALRQLKTRYRLAIISNVDDDLFRLTLPQLEIEFDEVITAQQAQAYKPALSFFELALRRINVPVDRVLHVGQSIYHDVIPAHALGISTVWVNRPSARPGVGAVKSAAGTPDLVVTSLQELAAMTLAANEGPILIRPEKLGANREGHEFTRAAKPLKMR